MIALVLAMVWTRRGQALTLALLTMAGVAAAVAAPAYLRAADRAVAAGQVAVATPADRGLSLVAPQPDRRRQPGPAGVQLTETGDTLPGFDYVYATEYSTVGIDPDERNGTRMVYRQQVCAHLAIVAGRCLIGESDVIVGERTARQHRIGPGQSITLTYARRVSGAQGAVYLPDGKPKRFLVAGVYRVPDPGAAYWGSHYYFTTGEPVFVTHASVATMDHGAGELSLDGSAPPAALAVDRLPAVRAGLDRLGARVAALGPGVELRTGLTGLLGRIGDGRAAAHRIVPVLAVCLVLLACLTIHLAVGYGTEGRRPELAVVALRGARWGQRWWLATGENLLAILAGTLAGCLAGQLLVGAFAAWRFPGVGADPGLAALRWAPAAAAAALLTALAAERRQLGRPVAELLRRVAPAPGRAATIAAEAVVVLLAVVAAAQLAVTGGVLTGVGTLATGLFVVAAALVAARLILPWATVVARRQLRRGRAGAALAAFQLSRRPGSARLFALLTATVAVVGYAASAVDVGAHGRAVEAVASTGTARVVTVAPVSRQALLAAVRRADPAGAYAMAAVRLPPHGGEPPVLAADTSRMAAVAAWGTSAPGAAALHRLHPADPAPDLVRGPALAFDVTAPGPSLSVTAVLTPPAGVADLAVPVGPLLTGRHTYMAAVPACVPACRLKSLVVGAVGTGSLVVHTIGGAAPAAGWEVTAGNQVVAGPDGMRVDVITQDAQIDGIVVRPPGLTAPLPVAVAGSAAVTAVTGLDGRQVPVAAALRVPGVPGLGAPAALADLDYLDQLAGDADPAAGPEVWLAASAPADVLDRLHAQGLTVVAGTRAGQARAGLDRQGPALALWFYLIVAALATALAAGALVLAAAVDRGREVGDLSALRGQGLARAAVRRATLWTYPVLVAAAVVAGTGIAVLGWRLTGWALPLAGVDPPPFPLPALPRPATLAVTAVAAFAVLAGAAVLAGRRTLRAIG